LKKKKNINIILKNHLSKYLFNNILLIINMINFKKKNIKQNLCIIIGGVITAHIFNIKNPTSTGLIVSGGSLIVYGLSNLFYY